MSRSVQKYKTILTAFFSFARDITNRSKTDGLCFSFDGECVFFEWIYGEETQLMLSYVFE